MPAPIIASASTQSHFFNELPSPIPADDPTQCETYLPRRSDSINHAFEIQNQWFGSYRTV